MYRSRGYSLPDATRPSLGLSSSSPAVKRRGSGDEKTDKTEERGDSAMSSQSAYVRRNSFRDYNTSKEGSSDKSSINASLSVGKDSHRRSFDPYTDYGYAPESYCAFTHFRSQSTGDDPDMSATTPSPRRFEMVSAGGKLAQEIHDEFLVCKICLEVYKNPKSLDCLHTFCEKCIENHVMSESTYKKYSDYREFTCPLCRKRTQLPIGGVKKLPDNFLVSNLGEVIGRQRPSKFPFCDICKMVNHKHREAASKCLDCAKLLCKQCVELHKETKVTSNHSIFDVEIEKDIECKEHQDEVVRFYCEPCETCICVLCTFNEHKDHEISQFGEAVSKYRDNIQVMLGGCKKKIQRFDDQLESLSRVETVIKQAEQQIHDTAIKFISDIRTREKHLIEELRNIYGSELMDYVDNKEDMSTTVEGLRSTCNLTEVILKGKDIELLLLKKDVQKKLTTLGEIEIKALPKTVDKVVNFIPGSIEVGVIEDKDRPVVSKMRNKIKPKHATIGEVDEDYLVEVEYSTRECQTELSQHDIKSRKSSKSSMNDSDDDDSDEDDSDEGDSDDDDDDDDEDEKEYTDIGVQTESPDDEDASEDEEEEKPEMKDEATETDEIPTEEKAVNTRSRSLQSVTQLRRSPPKNQEDDNSLAARRRRRRERAATTHFGSYSVDHPDSPKENTKPRSRFLPNHHSVDHEEVYYDADASTGNTFY